MGDIYVLVTIPVEDYLKRDTGPYVAAEALATEFGGVWVGQGVNMRTGMADIQYRMVPENVAGLIDALKSVGLRGTAVVL